MASGIDSGELLMRLLRAADLRSRAVASNIANLNTPGYRRLEVRFEDELARALERGGDRAAELEPRLVEDELHPPRADGNNADMELELAELRRNRLLSETYNSLLRARFDLVRAAIDGGR